MEPLTLDALAANPGITSDAYRTRENLFTRCQLSLAKPLTLDVGTAFNVSTPSVRPPDQTANALVADSAITSGWPNPSIIQDVYADYGLRVGTKLIHSDFAFASHAGQPALSRGTRQTQADRDRYRRCR